MAFRTEPSPVLRVYRELFQRAHQQLEDSIEGLDRDRLHLAVAPGAHPIAAQYVHVVSGEDWVIQRVLRGRRLLAFAEWEAKTGISELPILSNDWDDWASRVRIVPDEAKRYAAAVYAATDGYLASLTDEQLFEEVDLTEFFGPAAPNRSYGLAQVLLHITTHAGEISCLRGMV